MAASTWPKVMLFGASNTQRSFSSGNWGGVIADRLQRRCDVLNRGFSGYNSRWLLLILPKILTKEVVPELVAFIILLASNDSSDCALFPQLHVPLKEYKENILKIVEYAKSVGLSSEKIIIMTPPPVDGQAWNKYCVENHEINALDQERLGQYAQAASEMASSLGVTCIDLFVELQKEPKWESLFSEGLHFSEVGGAAVARLLWPHVCKRIQHLPEVIFPKWSEIDAENPQNTLLQTL